MAAFTILGAMLLLAVQSPADEGAVSDCAYEALETHLSACDELIARERNPARKARMLYRRAWTLNAEKRSEEALRDLDQALGLTPNFVEALQERAFALADLGEFDRALRDIDSAIAIKTDDPKLYNERAFIRRRLADFVGAHADRSRIVALKPGNAEALLDRADAALWLGRFDAAKGDTDVAAVLVKDITSNAQGPVAVHREIIRLWSTPTDKASPAKRCSAAGEAGDFGAANLIGDCSAAFLAATTGAEKALALTYRSLAWLHLHDPEMATIDREVAVALEPGNVDWLFNLGFSYHQLGRHASALRLFERSLAVEETAAALAGRAASHYHLGQKPKAAADARRAVALKPNPLAYLILGYLAFESGDNATARAEWMRSYRAGWRDRDLVARLKSVGVDDPAKEPDSP